MPSGVRLRSMRTLFIRQRDPAQVADAIDWLVDEHRRGHRIVADGHNHRRVTG